MFPPVEVTGIGAQKLPFPFHGKLWVLATGASLPAETHFTFDLPRWGVGGFSGKRRHLDATVSYSMAPSVTLGEE